MVVEGQLEIGQAPRARRARAQSLDAGTQPVAEIPEPAAADDATFARAGRDQRLVLEQGERVNVGRGNPNRLRPDQGAAAGPTADQDERTVVVANDQGRLLRLEPPREGKPDGAGGRALEDCRSSGDVRDGTSSAR